ncbi:biotin--[acetyl-CoA-carboxylase] ligase [Thioalkalivibrio sp. ALJ1]|uniref:biotin--[acetyl-CoA-carboxylase] ligase n=1 Tax=Thioalkalivibrio sp. ALJ1 TaxID=1158144 RepID=UPI000476A9FD|nr:biotin--[acetyl-CoA-carboxylase] ligase [Thioalkalivibrio sp. ALJ1]
MARESARLKVRVECLLSGTGVAMPVIEVLESVGSTNQHLLQASEQREQAPRACLAMSQTAGRGRRGRMWHSAPGKNLALSMAWPLSRSLVPPAYPVGAGTGVVRALEEFGLSHVRLKWPNDLMVGDAKLGGILVEQRLGSASVPGRLVVGIGINLASVETLNLGRPVIDLAALGVDVDLLELASHVIAQQCRLHSVLMEEGLASLAPELERMDMLRDQPIEVLDSGARGWALGIDLESGCLNVRFEDGVTRTLHSGEVSVRRCEHV